MLKRGEDALIEYLKRHFHITDNGESFMRRLYQLSQRVTAGAIVELGAYVGRSAIALAWDATEPIYSIDDFSDHIDWSNKEYNADSLRQYERNVAAASVSTVLIRDDVRRAALTWNKPIGLLVWDVSEPKRLLDDWQAWRGHIVFDGFALLRDTFDRRLGSNDVINFEYSQHEFTIDSLDPGLFTLRRYG